MSLWFFSNGTNPPTVGAEEEVDIIVIQVLVRFNHCYGTWFKFAWWCLDCFAFIGVCGIME